MSLALRESSVLRGFNVHHGTTVIRQEIDLGRLAGLDSRKAGPDFAERFGERFGSLRKLPKDRAKTEAFVDRLRSEGVPFAEVLLHAILAAEFHAAFVSRYYGGVPVAEVAPGLTPERPLLVWSCRIPGISRRAAEVGLLGLDELLPEDLRRPRRPGAGGYDAAYTSFKAYAAGRAIGYNLAILVDAAETRKIPWERFDTNVVRLGQGKFQHIFYNSVTDQTSFVAQRTAQNKNITSRVLADHGIPVPRNICPDNVDGAVTAAGNIGYPVVIKPVDGGAGAGVCVGIRSPDEVPPAFEQASRSARRGVMVESFVRGDDHRLLVVNGRCVAATKRVKASVTGDGKKTIRELVKDLNSDPRRDGFTLLKVHINAELKRLLQQAGYELDTVLPEGEKFAVRSMSNYHAGGYTIDVTDAVHPHNRELAILSAQAIGLDVAGVDFLTPDISKSHREVGGAVIEVNCRPGLDLHTWPAEGKPRDVAGAIIEMMIPPGEQARVPVAVIASARREEPAARALDSILRAAGRSVALVRQNRTVATINGSPMPQEGRRRNTIRSALGDKRVELMVRAASPRGAARQGLYHDACNVAALVIPAERVLLEEERQGLGVVVDATSGMVAVSSQSGDALEAVRGLDPSRVALVSLDADDEVVGKHVEAGGLAVVLSGDDQERTIQLRGRQGTLVSRPAGEGPVPTRRRERRLMEAQLFAVALAHGLGLAAEEIAPAAQPPGTGSASQES